MSDPSVHEELGQQLLDQKESLREISEMLAVDPSEQLQQLYEELLAGLQETQLALAEYEPLVSDNTLPGQPDAAAPALQHPCRFLAPNGSWYLGRITTEDNTHATVQFTYPSEPYQLQPLQILKSALQPCPDQQPQQSLHTLPAGSPVFARLAPAGLFERAEFHSVHPTEPRATVTALSSGLQHQIPLDQVTMSVVPQGEDQQGEQPGWGSSGSDLGADSNGAADSDFNDDNEDDEPVAKNPTAVAVLGANLEAARAAAAGPQTDTAHFAQWEGATRGIGSKLLAGMGYVKGGGLGQNQRGMANPLAVVSYRAGAGLGSMPVEATSTSAAARKRKRGGAKNRQKKHAKKSRDAREQRRDSLNQHEMATGDAGLFSLINSRLGDRPRPRQPHQQAASHSDAHHSSLHTSKRQSKFADSHKVVAAPKPPDRKALIAHQDHTVALKQRVVKLEAMAARNSNDKVISAQVASQLEKARAEVSHAEATSSGHASALSDKERQKKWMKF